MCKMKPSDASSASEHYINYLFIYLHYITTQCVTLTFIFFATQCVTT